MQSKISSGESFEIMAVIESVKVYHCPLVSLDLACLKQYLVIIAQ